MKKIVVAIMLLCFLVTGAVAGDTRGSLSLWLKNMYHKLKMVTTKEDKKEDKRAVAGVKGVEQRTDEELYWKELVVSDEELSLMESALEHIEKGERKKAIEKMEKLLKEYPESPLAEDAKKGLKLLRAEER